MRVKDSLGVKKRREDAMQVRNAAIWLAVGVSVGLSFALLWRSVFVTRALAQDAVLNLGAVTSEIRFDESMGSMRPLPVVPKDWRFVGVSNGERGTLTICGSKGVTDISTWCRDSQHPDVLS